MTVKERLIIFIKFMGLSQGKFEKLVGLSNGYVNNIRQSIQPKTVQSIALKYPKLNTGWLLTGEGKMIKEEIEETSSGKHASEKKEDKDYVKVPREAWNVIQTQAQSLLEKDMQMARVLTLIEKRFAFAEQVEQQKAYNNLYSNIVPGTSVTSSETETPYETKIRK